MDRRKRGWPLRDSNPDASRRRILNPLRLPFRQGAADGKPWLCSRFWSSATDFWRREPHRATVSGGGQPKLIGPLTTTDTRRELR